MVFNHAESLALLAHVLLSVSEISIEVNRISVNCIKTGEDNLGSTSHTAELSAEHAKHQHA